MSVERLESVKNRLPSSLRAFACISPDGLLCWVKCTLVELIEIGFIHTISIKSLFFFLALRSRVVPFHFECSHFIFRIPFVRAGDRLIHSIFGDCVCVWILIFFSENEDGGTHKQPVWDERWGHGSETACISKVSKTNRTRERIAGIHKPLLFPQFWHPHQTLARKLIKIVNSHVYPSPNSPSLILHY